MFMYVIDMFADDEQPSSEAALTSIETARTTQGLAAPSSETARTCIGPARMTRGLAAPCAEAVLTPGAFVGPSLETALTSLALAGPGFETALMPFAFTERRTQTALPHAGPAVTGIDDTLTSTLRALGVVGAADESVS